VVLHKCGKRFKQQCNEESHYSVIRDEECQDLSSVLKTNRTCVLHHSSIKVNTTLNEAPYLQRILLYLVPYLIINSNIWVRFQPPVWCTCTYPTDQKFKVDRRIIPMIFPTMCSQVIANREESELAICICPCFATRNGPAWCRCYAVIRYILEYLNSLVRNIHG
jgi:hypothetical protein